MTNPLHSKIINHILHHGPIGIDAFMKMALYDPEHGYYTKRDPFGAKGDFTTAPEISQMFGEMIGIWLANHWISLDRPEKILLVEAGPGRGALMADILRSTKNVAGFREAMDIHLIEISPTLIDKQKLALSGINVTWHDVFDTVPDTAPIMVVANEFLDALPFKQYQKANGQWHERLIGVDEEGALCFGLSVDPVLIDVQGGDDDDIFEKSTPREAFVHDISSRVKSQGGGALMIDYGHDKQGFGDTFQAVKNHQYADVLGNAGSTDLTSHVNFNALKKCCNDLNAEIITQGKFLKAQGIELRAEMLRAKATEEQKTLINAALERLIHKDQMGTLFKVMEMHR